MCGSHRLAFFSIHFFRFIVEENDVSNFFVELLLNFILKISRRRAANRIFSTFLCYIVAVFHSSTIFFCHLFDCAFMIEFSSSSN